MGTVRLPSTLVSFNHGSKLVLPVPRFALWGQFLQIWHTRFSNHGMIAGKMIKYRFEPLPLVRGLSA